MVRCGGDGDLPGTLVAMLMAMLMAMAKPFENTL